MGSPNEADKEVEAQGDEEEDRDRDRDRKSSVGSVATEKRGEVADKRLSTISTTTVTFGPV